MAGKKRKPRDESPEEKEKERKPPAFPHEKVDRELDPPDDRRRPPAFPHDDIEEE